MSGTPKKKIGKSRLKSWYFDETGTFLLIN